MSKTNQDITSRSNLGRFFTKINRQLKENQFFHGKINLKNHPASKTELIGTIFHTGFDLITQKDDQGHLHFTLKKIGEAGSLDEIHQAKKIIFKQERIGKHGKKIQVLKLRTMYPMAHKAHEYLLKNQKLGPYGKIKNDFRITPRGKFFRRYWIDELLQLINILRGEMKLVGLRPLSEGFFKTMPKSLQQERIKHLPGLMAAIYADAPKNLNERIKSELKYLQKKQKHPMLTDVSYFFKVIWAIIFRGQRGY